MNVCINVSEIANKNQLLLLLVWCVCSSYNMTTSVNLTVFLIMTTKKQWWKDQGVLLSDFKRLNPWFRTEKDEKFITNEKINFETNGVPYKQTRTCKIEQSKLYSKFMSHHLKTEKRDLNELVFDGRRIIVVHLPFGYNRILFATILRYPGNI